MKNQKISRRKMLKSTAAGAALFTIVPRHVLGGIGYKSPSDVITRGIIGAGGGISGIHYSFESFNNTDTKILGVCNVDSGHMANGKSRAESFNGDNTTVDTYGDWREIVARPDIDVIQIPTPPHWHGLMSIAAAQAGKDVICEKPMTRTIGEGIRVREAMHRYKRMFRIDTWFRYKSNFYGTGTDARTVKKVVRSGALGNNLVVTVGGNQGFNWKLKGWNNASPTYTPQSVPGNLDYDMWLGPAPYKPYHSSRVHGNFRKYWDYDGGGLGDMGMHYLDAIQYILDKDDESPIDIKVKTGAQHPDVCELWEEVVLTYADGTKIVLDGDNSNNAKLIVGSEGHFQNPGDTSVPQDAWSNVELEPQIGSFLESIQTRKKHAMNEDSSFRSTTIVNLALAAIKLGRDLKFDSDKLEFIGDDEANRLIWQPMRSPWNLDNLGM